MTRRPRGTVLLLLAGVVAAFASFVAATGGIDTRIAGIAVRSRSWERPATLAAILAVAGLYSIRHTLRHWSSLASGAVVPVLVGWALLAGLGPEAEEERVRQSITQAVEAVTDPRIRVPVAIEVLRGDPAERLAEAAHDADLLVVASRGRGHLRQAVLGSVSEGVIRQATCPVVVIPAAHAARPRTTEVAVRGSAG